ncbi:MAG: DUF4834 family protein [Salinivirgaceae bacterium]|nr:DUF4834 family protein [Salinivirgaceae bacterium]MDD4746930.1 DUF4834 family protein [Salinivirgaceae bacterium]MDY0280207.1 DUF4834 family protein [Salinivirgaceae bacterium]
MFRFLLIFILVLIILQFVGRMFFHWFIRRVSRRNQHNSPGASQSRRTKTGEVYVSVDKKETKNDRDGVGEYVDFEEVK